MMIDAHGAQAPRPPQIELGGISKRFGATIAVNEVSLSIEQGTVHALVGENGAGKSTLGKIIAGVHSPDTGEYLVDGLPVHFRSPGHALKSGVTMIAQELSLIPTRSVIENVYLGIEDRVGPLLNRAKMEERFAELVRATGFDLPAHRQVGTLSIAEQQRVEILRAVGRNARLIVMDEPTSRLSAAETSRFHEIVRSLTAQGTTIVFVSHFLEEVLSLSDTVTVLRDGRRITTIPSSTATPKSLVEMMVGREVDLGRLARRPHDNAAEQVLGVEHLSRAGVFQDVSISVKRGEIVGLAGLVGSGRSEVARAIFGADRLDHGSVVMRGARIAKPTVRRMTAAGVAMVPESRKTQGLFLGRSVRENVTLRHLGSVCRIGLVDRRAEATRVTALAEELGVKRASIEQPVSDLSGGNQQKVLFARWLMETPDVLIADEPTSGVDMGAKRAIHELLRQLADDGTGVLLISSEIDEVLGLADRIYVMREGKVVAELSADVATERQVLDAAFGTDTRMDQR